MLSSNYIKMAIKSEDIQAIWQPQVGNLIQAEKKIWVLGSVKKDENFLKFVAINVESNDEIYITSDIKEKRRHSPNALWIPRQEDIQDLCNATLPKFGYVNRVNNTMLGRFRNFFIKLNAPQLKSTCIEEIWISYFMSNYFDKMWDEESQQWLAISE